MRNLLLTLTLLAFTGWKAQSQTVEKKDTTTTKEVSGKLFFGLFKWGKAPENIPAFDFQFETSSMDSIRIDTSENDRVVMKSIFWGAIQWTEKKKKNTGPDPAEKANKNK